MSDHRSRWALSIHNKVLMLALIPLFLVTVVLVGFQTYSTTQSARESFANQYEKLIEERCRAMRDVVQTAKTAIEPIYASADVDDTEAKRQVADLLRSIRFGNNNYIFVYDYDGNNIAIRPSPELEGTNMIDTQTADGDYLIRDLINIAKNGGGFYRYEWDHPSSGTIEPKHSYVDRLEKWGWLIGTGVYVTDVDEAMANVKAKTEASIRQQTLFVVILGSTLFFVVALIAYVFVQRTTRPIKRASEAMQNIARGQGDLTRRLSVESNDEIGNLAMQFNAFVERMQGTLLDVRRSSSSVYAAAEDISRGSEELSTRTEQAAANLQETSSSMEEITSTVNHSADNAVQANKLVQSTAAVAHQGEQSMEQVEQTMEDINNSASKISAIITTIDSIAFQTNILALNASVEAARAGENGRGFAVVAQEVRILASRSSDASKEIRALIDASMQHTRSGAELVQNAGATMREIVESVAKVTDVIGEISAAAKEQRDGIGQINTAVAEMDTVTQQNASMVQESTTAAADMRSHAEHLSELISSFVLGNSEPIARHQPLPSTVPKTNTALLKRSSKGSTESSNAGDNWESF